MHETEDEEDGHPTGIEGDAMVPRRGALHLDREADAEQRREDRDELALHQPFDQRLHRPVGHPMPHDVGIHVGGKRRVEPAHVGGEDAEERGAAQAVDDRDAFGAGDRANRLGRHRLRRDSSGAVVTGVGESMESKGGSVGFRPPKGKSIAGLAVRGVSRWRGGSLPA